VDPQSLPWATELVTPPRPIDKLAPLWLLPPLAPPGTVVLMAPLGSLRPLALPWSVITLSAKRTSGSLAVLHPSTHLALSGCTFSPAPPWSSVPSASPQSSNTLVSPQLFVTTVPPGSPTLLIPSLVVRHLTLAPPIIGSAMDLHPGCALGLQQSRPITLHSTVFVIFSIIVQCIQPQYVTCFTSLTTVLYC